MARRSAVKARTQLPPTRSTLTRRQRPRAPQRPPQRSEAPAHRSMEVCARWRTGVEPRSPSPPRPRRALRSLARRHQALTAETAQLDAELLAACASKPTRRCSAACRRRRRDRRRATRQPPGTTPSGCAAKRPSRRCAAPAPSRRPRAPERCATASTAAATATPTTPCGASPSPVCACDERTIAYAARRRGEGKHQTRDPPLPQTPHRARGLSAHHRPAAKCHAATTCAANAPNAASPSTPQLRPSSTHTTRISALERGHYHNRDLAQRYQQHLVQITT